jgi:transcriptional regulator with XRE-family HTH domain
MMAEETTPENGTRSGPVAGGGTDEVLATVGPRLRALRREHRASLAEISASTGISVSTLSRLESGQRRATLELLLPLARAYQVPLDEIIAPPVADPRVRSRPFKRDDQTIYPLSRGPGGGPRAYKAVIPPGPSTRAPEQQTHEGYEWLYVLSGRLRLLLGPNDLVLEPGEAAEFDTRVPHWFGNAGTDTVEFLSLFGAQGERMHVRARPAARGRRGTAPD